MKIVKHTAKDMRQALRLVREQLGPDAVILTSKRTKAGVEVTAAIDFDAEQLEAQTAAPGEVRPFQPREFEPPPADGDRGEPDPYTIADEQRSAFARVRAAVEAESRESATRTPSAGAEAQDVAKRALGAGAAANGAAATGDTRARPSGANRYAEAPPRVEERPSGASREAPLRESRPTTAESSNLRAATAASEARQQPDARLTDLRSEITEDESNRAAEAEIEAYIAAAEMPREAGPRAIVFESALPQTPAASAEEMNAELRSLRRILETQLASLAWNDLTRRAPIHTEILRELTEVGLTPDFASQVVAQLPAGADLTLARRLSISNVAQRVAVTGDRWLDKGGRVALIGPTGVGKTTALAKLAVRWVLRHGARSLALISADSVRIGAHDQLQALGQMLDVRVYEADSLADLPKLLDSLTQTRFVLIDTMGSSQRDAQLSTRLQQLAAVPNLETALVLSAATQAGAIEEAVTRFATANATSCLLTKVDEAASIGGVLSVLSRAELPISYVSEGQRVPEDLRPARSLELVSRAVQLARTSGAAADEDLLRRRYGDVAHALA
jgi:flagellar biosynthesis protein FlhF